MDEKAIAHAEKELAYYKYLIKMIDCIYKKESKLPKNFLTDISKTIMEKTLSDDLQIIGLIHGLVINFHKSFSKIVRYFSAFVSIFSKASSEDMKEKINQIDFIYNYLKIIELAFEGKKDESADSNIMINAKTHSELVNLILYWITKIKDNQTKKSENILYILIQTIKNTNYLKLLKVILFGSLKFIIDKKNLIPSKNFTNEIYDMLTQTSVNYLNIDLAVNENSFTTNDKKLNNKKFFFEENSKATYNYQAEHIDFYEEILIELIKKCEKKIIKFSSFKDKEILERKINILFFENYSHVKKEKGNFINDDNDNNPNSDKRIKPEGDNKDLMKPLRPVGLNNLISESINFFKVSFCEFKHKYFKFDFFQQSNMQYIEELYEEFKNLINQNILTKLVYIFYLVGRNIDASILLQYSKDVDYDIIYKLLQTNAENHALNKLEFIWKIAYFEILADSYFKLGKHDYINYLKDLMRRTSNHQIFKNHPLRKHFKIINFLKYIDNLEYCSIR